jgi:ADP-heptose:LPS heptosyltransferase
MGEMCWVINIGKEDLEIIDMGSNKWVVLKPNRPQQVRRQFALDNIGRYHDFRACDNPEKYFSPENKLEHLIIRDGGIGDLLLLEPVLRPLSKTRKITIKTKHPSIYLNNPCVSATIPIDEKHNTEKFDCWDDLRNYSETADTRMNKHRSEVYNEKFNIKLEDKEPRIYESEIDVNPIDKKEGHKYFIIQCDASHFFRKYPRGEELANYIINADEKNIVVLLGGYDYIKLKTINPRIIDLQGKTNIREAIAIIRNANYFIGGDSGLMHIACALHTPALGIFSIITPDLRLRYYTGPYKAYKKEGLSCIGCGDSHMENCNFGSKKDPKFIPPCMDIDPKELYDMVLTLKDEGRRIFKKDEIKNVNIIKTYNGEKLTMPIIVLDEEKNLPRFIELVMSHPAIGRVVAIDGGSKDRTADMLTRAGAEVYEHPYLKHYHDQQSIQRNISFSYVADGTPCIFMDVDECFSKELSDYLYFLAEQRDVKYGLISRKTFNYYADITDPTKRIKDYPDFQPRYYVWDKKFKFVNGAHHWTLNCPEPVKIQKDIIHFEKEGKNRDDIETQWKNMMDGVRKYAN